jgi:peptidoglycan/xylan/chitin deacetylase (PgdA/CDA1 family)
MFWNMLQYLGIDQPRKSTKTTLLLTHDVDHPLLWPSARFFVKKLAGDLLKRRDAKEALFSISSFPKTAFFGKKDPYDNFNHLMNVAEKANLPAHFFFMAGTGTAFDPPVYLQWPFVKRLFESIQKRGHLIGFHPSYRTYNNADLFSKEKQALEEACGQAVTVGRQHFLRFQAPLTWRIWADNGMEWDSTLAYAEQPGFRCGSCLPFPVFDIERSEILPLWERSLIVMEGSYRSYMNLTPPQMEANMMALWQTTSKYGGEFTFLWHNSAFETPYYLPYQDLYHRFVSMASQSN